MHTTKEITILDAGFVLKFCLTELHGRNLEPGAVLANFGDPTDLTHFALELWQMADVAQLAVNHRLALKDGRFGQ